MPFLLWRYQMSSYMPTFYLRELPFLFSKNGLSLAVALLLAGCALGPAYPVSYTHLDVYKRQRRWSGGWV